MQPKVMCSFGAFVVWIVIVVEGWLLLDIGWFVLFLYAFNVVFEDIVSQWVYIVYICNIEMDWGAFLR